jgi:ribulose-bisphosphate carboxylase large chain
LSQKWFNIKSVFPVSSGGLHPGHVPFLIKHLGKDLVIQAGGGIHGHPSGTEAGAKAMRQAVEAVLKRKTLEKYSETHKELKQALKQWSIR